MLSIYASGSNSIFGFHFVMLAYGVEISGLRGRRVISILVTLGKVCQLFFKIRVLNKSKKSKNKFSKVEGLFR